MSPLWKERIKGMIAGALISTMVFSSLVMFAEPVRKKIDVIYNDMKIFVNGVEKPVPADQKPFIFNGRTYVPLRYLGEVMGKKVATRGKDNAIFINDYAVSGKEFKKIDLYTRPYVAQTGNKPIIENNVNAVVLRASLRNKTTSSVTYALNGQAKEFTADVSIKYGEYGIMKLEIYDEYDNKLYESPVIKDGMDDIRVKLDVTNLLQIRLVATQVAETAPDYNNLAVKNMVILTTEY